MNAAQRKGPPMEAQCVAGWGPAINQPQPSGDVAAMQSNSRSIDHHAQAAAEPERTLPKHPAAHFLQLLGKDPEACWFRTLKPKSSGGAIPNSDWKGRDLQGLDLHALTRANGNGSSIYLIPGDAAQATGACGVTDADITSVPALFVEWDNKPLEWQAKAWQTLQLPEPSVIVASGGKSLHCYWVLNEPLEPVEWRRITALLIAYCDSDKACSNPSRLMRLPGFAYIDKKTFKPNGNIAEILHESGKRYSPAEIEACLPQPVQPAIPAPAAPAERPEEALRDLLAGGRDELPPRAEWVLLEALKKIPPFQHDQARRDECLGLAFRLHVDYGKERAIQLLTEHSPALTDVAGYFNVVPTKISTGSIWEFLRDNYGVDISRWDLKKDKRNSPSSTASEPAPRPSKPKERKARPMSHSKAMACLEQCVKVQAQRERNSLRRRARLLKAAKDLGLAAFINRQEIAQKVLEAKARCSGEGFKPLTAADRAAMPKPVVRWLVRGLIPAGDMTIIGGRPKVGKTRVAVAIVAAVLRGESFLEFPVAASPPPVLLVTDDQSAGDTADMLTALDLWSHPRLITSEHFRLTEPDLDALLAAIKANPGALVVLDSLRSIGRALPTSENDPEIGATLYDLKQAVIDAGGTLLLIHHCNKAADLVGVEALSGHNAIGGAANTVITLHHCPNDKGLPDKINPQRRLFSEGRSGEGCDVVIDRSASGSFRQVSTFEHWQQQLSEAKKNQKLERLTELQQQALDALNDSGDWMTRRQVCEALELPWGDRGQSKEAKNLAKTLTRLLELGAIESANPTRETTYRSCDTQMIGDLVDQPVTAADLADSSDWGSRGSRGSSPTAPDPLIPLIPLIPFVGDQRNPLAQQVDPLDPPDPTRNSPPAPPSWPTWSALLLQLRADHPDQLPMQLANLLQAEHGITTDGRAVKAFLKAWDARLDVEVAA